MSSSFSLFLSSSTSRLVFFLLYRVVHHQPRSFCSSIAGAGAFSPLTCLAARRTQHFIISVPQVFSLLHVSQLPACPARDTPPRIAVTFLAFPCNPQVRHLPVAFSRVALRIAKFLRACRILTPIHLCSWVQPWHRFCRIRAFHTAP